MVIVTQLVSCWRAAGNPHLKLNPVKIPSKKENKTKSPERETLTKKQHQQIYIMDLIKTAFSNYLEQAK